MTEPWYNGPITQGYGPTDEPLDSGYQGYAHFNKGLDYGLPTGTPITALVGGTVLSAGDSGDGWGISIKIKDANGYIHNYGHLDSVNVKVGQTINAGDLVALSGNSGNSTGPHLSYDVADPSGNYIDPSGFVPTGGNTRMANLGPSGIDGRLAAPVGSPVSDAANTAYGGVRGLADMIGGGNTPTVVGTPLAGSIADQLDVVIEEMSANRPDKSSAYYQQNPDLYQVDLAEWVNTYTSVASLREQFKQAALGLISLPDGTVMAYGDATPEQQRQIEAANQTQYASILNKFGLDQYDLIRQYVGDTNSVAQTGFNNEMDRISTGISRDNLSLSKAQQELDSWIKSQSVAEGDAARIADAKNQAIKYGTTGGKTSFTGNDLGGGVAKLAQQGGINPSSAILSYPGYQTYTPVQDRLDSLAGMGVSNAPPATPMLNTPTAIPGAPALQAPPPPPMMEVPGYERGPDGFLHPKQTAAPPLATPGALVDSNGIPIAG